MAIKLIKENNSVINGTGQPVPGGRTYLMDGDSDVASLPTQDLGVGSQAISIASGATYILGPSLTWIKFGGNSSVDFDN